MDDAIHKGRHDPFGFYDRQTHKNVRKLSCLEENIQLEIRQDEDTRPNRIISDQSWQVFVLRPER